MTKQDALRLAKRVEGNGHTAKIIMDESGGRSTWAVSLVDKRTGYTGPWMYNIEDYN